MSTIILPSRNTQQPKYPTKIDTSNPLSRGLVSAVISGTSSVLYDHALRSFLTDPYGGDSFSALYGVAPEGMWRSKGAGAYRNTYGADGGPPIAALTDKYTLITFVRPRVTTLGPMVIAEYVANGGWTLGAIELGNGTNSRFFGRAVSGHTTSYISADADYVVGKYYQVAYTSDLVVGKQNLFVNGVKQSTQQAYTAAAGKQLSNFVIGGGASSDGFAEFYGTLFFNRVLSDSEIAEISRNPYQLFKAPNRKMLVSVSGGTFNSYSYSGTGGIVLSGGSTTGKGRAYGTAGGITYSGNGQAARGGIRSVTGGGVTLSGSSSMSSTGLRQKIVTAVGGFILSGTSSLVKSLRLSAFGGISFSGSANAYSPSIAAAVGALMDVISMKLRLSGKMGAINDMLNENQYWRALSGGSNAPLNDVKKSVLKSQGRNGAMNDMESNYWKTK